MLSCYNRGCGQNFDPANNKDGDCQYHPGTPFFQDAYKGWSCCKTKSVDFTEFLNIKGCTKAKHSNEKPPEPKKAIVNERLEQMCKPRLPAPIQASTLERPPFESPLVTLLPTVAANLRAQIDALVPSKATVFEKTGAGDIKPGTICKRGGCNFTYETPATNDTDCVHHPGVPVFHEGLKYWSCCKKHTSDFSAFINQIGCSSGRHKWLDDTDASKSISARYDWHQTANEVVVAIYAKMYDYKKSSVRLHPTRLSVCLVFPQLDHNEFNLDIELRGVVKPSEATVHMYATKVEITMPKAEAGSWPKLDFPVVNKVAKKSEEPAESMKITEAIEDISYGSDSDVGLDDIEPAGGIRLSEI